MWVVIPVKDLNSSKSRLAHALPDHARPALMGALLSDLLLQLRRCAVVEGIAVVTRCPQASALARSHDAEVLSLPEDRCLNSGVAAAVTLLQQRGLARVLVLHADVPMATPADLESLAAAHQAAKAQITLVPDTRCQGTNAMLLELPTTMRFAYGENSFARHRDIARELGLTTHVVENPRIGSDLDLWQDFVPLLSLQTSGQRPQLARWLEQYSDLFDWPLAANQ